MIYGYSRVSTRQQMEEGESLKVQERTIAGYAMMKGMPEPKIFVEPMVSGGIPIGERPQGKLLMEVLQPHDVVITPKLDRMFRSAHDALTTLDFFKRKSIELHMIDLGGDVTGSGVSKLLFTIISAFAENERERARERIQDIKTDQKSRGRYLGGSVPFGFDATEDGELIPNVIEQANALRVKELRAQGKSYRTIANEIGSISHQTVAKILAA